MLVKHVGLEDVSYLAGFDQHGGQTKTHQEACFEELHSQLVRELVAEAGISFNSRFDRIVRLCGVYGSEG